MSEFVIYTVPGSPFSRAVEVALEEKGVPYRLVALKPGDHKAPEHLARHPFGRLPAVQHGDFAFYETQAIIRYVDQAFDGPPLQPADPKAAARMNQVLGVVDWYFFPKVAQTVVFQRLVGPKLLGLSTDEAVIEAALPEAKICIDALEGLLGDQRYFAGESVSLADISLAPQLAYFARTPEGERMLAGSRLALWLERMEARPSMLATLPPEALRQAA